MRYTQTTLKKLEELFEELGYVVRYEKGSFNSGYCLVENRKIAVINKFFDAEARCNCLVDIMYSIEIDQTLMSEKSLQLYEKIRKSVAQEEETDTNPPA